MFSPFRPAIAASGTRAVDSSPPSTATVRTIQTPRVPSQPSGGSSKKRAGMKLPRFFEHEHEAKPADRSEPVTEPRVFELDPEQLRGLSNVFAAPKWLRDAGIASWLLAGVAILLVGLTWLLALTETIVGPVMVGTIVAVVASPGVAWLARHRVGRTLGAALVVLGVLAIAVVILLLVVGGITSQGDAIRSQADAAIPKVQKWLTDVGINEHGAKGVTDSVSSATSTSISTLVHGLFDAIKGLAS